VSKLVGIFEGQSFEEYCAIDAANKSGLDKFLKSPLHYWAEYLDPNREPREDTPALKLGKAIHCAVLEPARFIDNYKALPKDLDRRTKDGKASYEAIISSGSIPLSSDDFDTCVAISESIKKSIAAREIFAKGKSELTAVWEDSKVRCKARIDWFTDDHAVLIDLKSTEDAGPEAFARSLLEYGYHRQAAWYVDGLVAATNLSKEPLFVFAVYEKKPPYASAFYYATPEMLEQGRVENRRLLSKYIECRAAKSWPGYPEELRAAEFPRWFKPLEA